MRLLVDECLSPELTNCAHNRGHESSHVVWLGYGGLKDWQLKRHILEGDWTFVTKNSVDFRGPASNPGTRGQYADVAIHAGLICLNGRPAMNLHMQIELFTRGRAGCGLGPREPGSGITMESARLHVLRYRLPQA
jgi:Domain of unknown function (DUF5615)